MLVWGRSSAPSSGAKPRPHVPISKLRSQVSGSCDPQEVAAAIATLANTTMANQPNTTAYAVPRLTLLMQVMPMAVRIKVQILKTSNGVSKARSTAEPSGPMKYPALVATGLSMMNPSPLTPARSDSIANSVVSSSGSLVYTTSANRVLYFKSALATNLRVANKTPAKTAYMPRAMIGIAYEIILVTVIC